MYAFSYFKTKSEALHLATSKDGYHWTEYNKGQAILKGTVGKKTLRDPFIFQDEMGLFHLLSTDGWQSPHIVHATSEDLIDWTQQELLPVMSKIKGTQNAWAPECIYDHVHQIYVLYWSSTVKTSFFSRKHNHRIWSTTTKDFKTFSEAKCLFDPGYNVIDATMLYHKGHYLMAFKDERGHHGKHAKFKGIRLCSAPSALGPFENISDIVSPKPVEGPTLYQIEGKLVMFYDYFTKETYGASISSNGIDWQEATAQFSLPNHLRHGAVFELDFNIK